MRILRFHKSHLEVWLDLIAETADLYVPKKAGEKAHRFERYEDFQEVDLSYTRTILPPKKFLFPPEETLFSRDAGSDSYHVPEIPDRDVVLFGVHPCDINGIRVLDVFFGSFDRPDYYYQRRRKKLRIVGHSCMPDENCFCQSMDAETAASGFDLFLNDMGDHYLVTLGTVEGDLLLGDRADTLPEATAEDMTELMAGIRRRREAFTLELDTSIVPQAVSLHQADPVWEELGEKCLTCGCCSLGCPTCTCFNIRDTNTLGGSAKRSRTWDACLYRDFATVAGGYNFRPNRGRRVQHRYYHKQVGFAQSFGQPSCVGCGRCIKMCPTGIHFVEVFRALQENSLKQEMGRDA